MVIGVFIAPILLYWEALSSEFEDKAILPSVHVPTPLPNPPIPALVAVCRFDQERLRFDFQQLILIGGARRDAAKNVADVGIVKRFAPDGPSAGEIRDDPRPMSDLTRERPVGFEGVVTALRRVSVPPITHEF